MRRHSLYWQAYVWKHESPAAPAAPRIYEAHVGMSSIEQKVNSYRAFVVDVLPRIAAGGYNSECPPHYEALIEITPVFSLKTIVVLVSSPTLPCSCAADGSARALILCIIRVRVMRKRRCHALAWCWPAGGRLVSSSTDHVSDACSRHTDRYHVTNYFAVSSRSGTPDDLKFLIDTAHGLGLRVLLDVVHSHASNNVSDGLNGFDFGALPPCAFWRMGGGRSPEADQLLPSLRPDNGAELLLDRGTRLP